FAPGDFDWSEPPRRRRRITEAATPARRRRVVEEPIRATVEESIRVTRASAVAEYEPEFRDEYESSLPYEPLADDMPPARSESWDHPTSTHNHFDEMMAQWNAEYGDGARRDPRRTPMRAFDLSDPGSSDADALGARRTVLITGRGDERYMPALRRPRESELRFHERSGFSPDRAGLWAVLLGVALLIGSVAH
ncbi:MAG: hypothetical protein ACRDLR_02910, partial [Gaiellaceae bacterium]